MGKTSGWSFLTLAVEEAEEPKANDKVDKVLLMMDMLLGEVRPEDNEP